MTGIEYFSNDLAVQRVYASLEKKDKLAFRTAIVNAFNKGVLNAKTPSKESISQQLTDILPENFTQSEFMALFLKNAFTILAKHSTNGSLNIGFEEIFAEDVADLFVNIYGTAFANILDMYRRDPKSIEILSNAAGRVLK